MPNPCAKRLPREIPTPTTGSSNPTFAREGNYFIYCNNPERIEPSHLGDRNKGNHSLLWSRVSGACQAWYEHTNGCGSPINYGLLAYNANATAVTITVTNSGFSADPLLDPYWTRFFRGERRVITIPPQRTAWLLQQTSIPRESLLEGVIRFSVSGGEVTVMNYAYQDLSQLDGYQTYIGHVCSTNGSPKSREYKGIAVSNGAPCGGYVLLCDQTVDVTQGPRSWRTNGCKLRTGYGDCVGTDMLAFQCPHLNGSNLTFDCSIHRGFCDNELRPDNLGNWGVQYIYRTQFQNNSRYTYEVHLVVAQPNRDGASTIYIVDPDNATGTCRVTGGQHWDFYTFSLGPWASVHAQYQVILCGNSNGGILNSVVARRV